MTELDPAVVRAVVARAHALGLKGDLPPSRVVRVVQSVAAAHGVEEADAVRPPLLDEAVQQLAVHESWFFRDARLFEALAREIVPTLTPPVRVWSVGCADGQEPWSLAMLLAESVDGDWHVTATDFSAAAVARAERGVYRTSQLRGLSMARRSRFVEAHGKDRWAVKETLRSRVTFVRHNIVTDPPPLPAASCDVVLCRNVMIYFHPDAMSAALSSIKRTMTAEGWLLLGTAESLFGISDEFAAIPLPGAFAYRIGVSAGGRAAPSQGLASRGSGLRGLRSAPRVARPDPAALVAAGDLAHREGRLDDAVRSFRQAAYLDPDRADAHAGLADALDALGDARGAMRARAAARRLGA